MIEAADYGKALYSLALETKKDAEIYEQLTEVSQALSENREFIGLLDTPALSTRERLEIAERVFGSTDTFLLNFVKILTQKRSMHLFSKCCEFFIKECDKAHNVERVEAITAVKMSDALLSKLQKKLSKITQKQVLVSNSVDPEIIGGITLRFENRQIDASIAARLKDAQKHISVTL